QHVFVQKRVFKAAVDGLDNERAVVGKEEQRSAEAEPIDRSQALLKLRLIRALRDVVNVLAQMLEEQRRGTVEVCVVEGEEGFGSPIMTHRWRLTVRRVNVHE